MSEQQSPSPDSMAAEIARLREQIRALEAAAQPAAVYRDVFDRIPAGILIIDVPTQRILAANAHAAALTGSDAGALAGAALSALFPNPSPAPAADAAFYEDTLRGAADRHRPVLRSSLLQKNGGTERQIELFMDVSGYRRLARNLRWEQDFAHAALDSLPGLFYLFTESGRLLRWNKNFELLAGARPADLAQANFFDFFYEPDRQLLQAKVAEIMAAGRASWEAAVRTADGRGPMHAFAGTLTNIGAQRCVIGEALDISRRVRSEQSLHIACESLRSIVEKVSDAVAIVGSGRRIRFMNQKAREFLRDRADIQVGGSWRDDFCNAAGELMISQASGAAGVGRVLTAETIWEEQSCTLVVIQDISESRAAEQASKQLYETMRLILEKMPFGVYIVGRTGAVDYVNPAMLAISGDTYDEFMRMNVFELPSYRQAGVTEIIRAAFAPQMSALAEVEYVSFYGRKKTVRNFFCIPVTEGSERKVIVFVEDITRQKENAVELQRSYLSQSAVVELLSLALGNVPLENMLERMLTVLTSKPWLPILPWGGIALAGAGPKKIETIAAVGPAKTLCANCEAILLDSRWSEQAVEEERLIIAAGPAAAACPGQCISAEPYWRYCIPFLSPNRQVRGVLTLFIAQQSPAAKDPWVSEIFTIIANTIAVAVERKRLEERLALSMRQYQSVVENINLGIMLIDPRWNIIAANRQMRRWFPRIEGSSPAHYCYEACFGAPPGAPCAFCPGFLTFQDGGVHQVTQRVEVDAQERFYQIIACPIAGEGGNVAAAVIVVEDISERIQAEQEHRKIVDMKSRFVSVVSHELRTPLTAIKEGIATVLDGTAGALNPDQQELLTLAKRNVDRLARLINDVLNFQKLEMGRVGFDFRPHALNEIIQEVYTTMRGFAEQKHLDFRVDCGADMPDIICDRDKITQVLTNLVHNALKFTAQGTVTIRALPQAPHGVVVSVSDTGPGIDKKDIVKLFQQFVQLGDAGTRLSGSAGLGLAISRQIIERHRGKIWVESAPGEGTLFSFYLPDERQDDPAERRAE
ncbi:MAG: PAS domain S-box protein [Candidatus Omnitrophica bacterium]|nr:PAS domain S-box protein [Candidatus Omnitrophota bacterium]